MKKEIIKISGMSCNHCVKSVEDAIKALPVEKYHVTINLLDVEYDELKISHQQISEAIEEEGYTVINNN
jgi:copper chaperone